MKRLSFLLLLIITTHLYPQDKAIQIHFNGYVNNMQSVLFDSLSGNWTNDNLIHNRLNFELSYKSMLTFHMSARTRIFTGETVKNFPAYADFIKHSNAFWQLSWNWLNKPSILANTTIDRLFLKFTAGNFELTAGRQRINWAKTFVWNPNDLFNNYSFFDFDYPERPGSDAIDAVYYLSPLTNIELATKLDRDTNLTAAFRLSTTIGTYDLQLIGGILSQNDYVLGLGWTGYINQFTFRGEASYLQPKNNFLDTTGQAIVSIGLDYSFGKSNLVMIEFLYNQQKQPFTITSPLDFYSAPMDIKHLSFSEYNIFAQITTQPHPLLSLTLAAMAFPQDKGFFVMPNITYSIADNADLTLVGQVFKGKFHTPFNTTQNLKLFAFFIRLSLSFGR